MAKKTRIRLARLEALESEFEVQLVTCLVECAKGRYGLFGQNAHVDPEERYWRWPEAKRLRAIASEIRLERSQTGEINEAVEQFLSLCETTGSNVPGEPRLAAQFLDTIRMKG